MNTKTTVSATNKTNALNIILEILQSKEAARIASLSESAIADPAEYYVENEMITDQWDNIHFDCNNEELRDWYLQELIDANCLVKHNVAGDFYYDFE